MNIGLTDVVRTARDYYNSGDADNFYFNVWGGEDIHIGLYDDATRDIRHAAQRTVATMAARLDMLSARSRVIDLGAGYGGAARWLAGTTGCQVTCLNLSDVQNERNRELTAAAGLDDRIDVVDGSFEDIPYGAEEFDIAWSQDSLLHSGDRARVLREVDRVLKPGGVIVFTDPMQADDCPPGVLAPVLERIHLSSLGSFRFYRGQAELLDWEERDVVDMTSHLVAHYSRVREELLARRAALGAAMSEEYVEHMSRGLMRWIRAGEKGYLAWGILHFSKPL